MSLRDWSNFLLIQLSDFQLLVHPLEANKLVFKLVAEKLMSLDDWRSCGSLKLMVGVMSVEMTLVMFLSGDSLVSFQM
jgi:hypothetical protein